MPSPRPLRGVLFDLDGTLLDTAPDIAAAMNALRRENGDAELPYAPIRMQVSNGSAAVLRLGYADVEESRFKQLQSRLLMLYHARVAEATRLFDGFEITLQAIESAGIPWGIVTNKPGWLTDPLLDALALSQRASCVISGDSLPERKPHPRPLLVAAALMHCAPEDCVYVGDALRDITAGRAAGMLTLGASFGYLNPDEDIDSWPADGWLASPQDLLHWV
jgi:phosphoglycolate phosphatase